MKIFYDGLQEGCWFQGLHRKLTNTNLLSFNDHIDNNELLRKLLIYDRPDVILFKNDEPVLVVERTVEVPSGHNVGQRFGRLVGAAQMNIPTIYFGPYMAYKHGGNTSGPRYMNLRLFSAIEKLSEIENTSITIINWPVDEEYEIIRSPIKDERIKEYLEYFFDILSTHSISDANRLVKESVFEQNQVSERENFIRNYVVNPSQYDTPPNSVRIIKTRDFFEEIRNDNYSNFGLEYSVEYNIGMVYIRSDPYAGMSLLYSYLYCGGLRHKNRHLILKMPNITVDLWRRASRNPRRKDIRIYKLTADGILFRDGFLSKEHL